MKRDAIIALKQDLQLLRTDKNQLREPERTVMIYLREFQIRQLQRG